MNGSGSYGLSELGFGPCGSVPQFGVAEAVAVTPTLVRVRFSEPVAISDERTTSGLSYAFSPVVSVKRVLLESSASVLIHTGVLNTGTYTVTVTGVVSSKGYSLDRELRQAVFTGTGMPADFRAAPIAENRLKLVFPEPLSSTASVTDPLSYIVTDATNSAIPVVSVALEASLRSVVLTLGSTLQSAPLGHVRIIGEITTQRGAKIYPDLAPFQWRQTSGRASFSLGSFTGEVQRGPLGKPAGLVFFSPSLHEAVPNSEISVDFVRACTRAWDSYTFPRDTSVSSVLMTHGSALWVTPNLTSLNTTSVLFGSPFKLPCLRALLRVTHEDGPNATIRDSAIVVTLKETWDLSKVSLLNVFEQRDPLPPRWGLFDPSVVPFKTADNLAPIPPGATSHYVVLADPIDMIEPQPVALAAHGGVAEAQSNAPVIEHLSFRSGAAPKDVEVVLVGEHLDVV